MKYIFEYLRSLQAHWLLGSRLDTAAAHLQGLEDGAPRDSSIVLNNDTSVLVATYDVLY